MKQRKSNETEKRPVDVDSAIRDLVAKLKRNYSRELEADPRTFKKRIVRLVRRELPPGRGRPSDPRLDAAARMVAKGTPTREVLRWLVPGFDKVDEYGRYLAGKGLRAALARRRKHRAHKLSPT